MATEAQRTRLDPEVFRLPVEKIRDGYYTDAYFNFSKQLLEEQDRHPQVTMQVFQKEQSLLGGIDEAIAVLKLCSGYSRDGAWTCGWDELEVQALHEGDEIEPRETVMIRIAASDVPAAYRKLRETVTKIKARVITAQLNEQDRRNITAQLDYVATHYRHTMLIIVVSDEPEVDERLDAVLTRLSGRHDIMWAMVSDMTAR